jgi:hypothetical protein
MSVVVTDSLRALSTSLIVGPPLRTAASLLVLVAIPSVVVFVLIGEVEVGFSG